MPIEKGSKYFWSRNDEVQNQNYETGLWFDYDESQPIYEASGWIAQGPQTCKENDEALQALADAMKDAGATGKARKTTEWQKCMMLPACFVPAFHFSNMSTRHKVKLAMDIAASEFYNSEDMISD